MPKGLQGQSPMTYQVQFLRSGTAEKSNLFATFQKAHSYAAQEVARREPKPEKIAIVEIEDDGNEGRVHPFQVF